MCIAIKFWKVTCTSPIFFDLSLHVHPTRTVDKLHQITMFLSHSLPANFILVMKNKDIFELVFAVHDHDCDIWM